MGKFDKYDGLVALKYNDEEYKLDFTTDDMRMLTKISQNTRKNKGDVDLTSLSNIYLDIFKRSYPDEPEDKIKKFLKTELTSFNTAFIVASRMIKESTLKTLEQNIEKRSIEKVNKMLDELEGNFPTAGSQKSSPAKNSEES